MKSFLEQYLGIIGIVVIALVLYGLWRLLQPKKKVIGEDMMLNIKCRKCGWQGTVTKYHQVCRKCASKDLEQF